MIESIMFFGGGFLVASLLTLVVIPLVHHRAVRLTERRLEDAIPVSMAEIQADKDSLRAEFAMSARRLEMSVEQLKAKATAQLGEIARKTEAIHRLKAELAERTAITDELEATAKGLAARIHDTEQEHEAKAASLEATGHALAAKADELARAAVDINEQHLASDTQRVEIAVLKTQIEQFAAQVEELEHQLQDAARRLYEERVAVSTVTRDLEEKRQVIDILRPQMAQLEGEIAARSNELKNRAHQIDGLVARNSEQEELLRQRALEISSLEIKLAANKDEHTAIARRLEAERSATETLLATANQTIESHAGRIGELTERNAGLDEHLRQRIGEIHGLEQQLAANQEERNAATRQFEAERNALEILLASANETVESHADRIEDLTARNDERQRQLAQREEDISTLHQDVADRQSRHDALAERLDAAHTAVESHGLRIGDLETVLAERDSLLGRRDAEMKALQDHIAAIAAERETELERWEADQQSHNRLLQTAHQTLQTRASRIEDLEGWVGERDQLLGEREAEIRALNQEIGTLKDAMSTASERLHAETAQLETQLQVAIESRSHADAEVTALKQEAEATWRAERQENTLLRERISDIAARVAHLVMTGDKAGPIEAILAESESTRPDPYERVSDAAAKPAAEDNLTERIRKLRSAATQPSAVV